MSDREQASESTGTNGFGPRRRSTVRFALSTGIGLGIVLLLYLAQPGWFSTAVTPLRAAAPKATAAPTAAPTPRPRPVDTNTYIGGSHTVDNIKITVVGVEYTRGGEGRVANKNDTFAIVTLYIENQQGKDYNLIPDSNTCALQITCHFLVQDDQGEKNPPISYDPNHTALRAVILQNGGRHEGSYTFEAPARDEASARLQLLWYHDPLGDANNIQHWILTGKPRHGR